MQLFKLLICFVSSLELVVHQLMSSIFLKIFFDESHELTVINIQLLKRTSLRIDIQEDHTLMQCGNHIDEPIAISLGQFHTLVSQPIFDDDQVVLDKNHVAIVAYGFYISTFKLSFNLCGDTRIDTLTDINQSL